MSCQRALSCSRKWPFRTATSAGLPIRVRPPRKCIFRFPSEKSFWTTLEEESGIWRKARSMGMKWLASAAAGIPSASKRERQNRTPRIIKTLPFVVLMIYLFGTIVAKKSLPAFCNPHFRGIWGRPAFCNMDMNRLCRIVFIGPEIHQIGPNSKQLWHGKNLRPAPVPGSYVRYDAGKNRISVSFPQDNPGCLSTDIQAGYILHDRIRLHKVFRYIPGQFHHPPCWNG